MYEKHTLLTPAEDNVLIAFLDLERHYFGELIRITKLTKPRTLRILRKFVKIGILEVKKEANIKYYSLKKTPLIHIMLSMVEYDLTLAFLNKNKLLKRALDLFKEKCGDYLVILLFGSVVKGYATKTSDVDLLLIKESFSKRDIQKSEDLVNLIQGRTGLRISPYFMKRKEFERPNGVAKEAITSHLLIDGAELFYKMVFK